MTKVAKTKKTTAKKTVTTPKTSRKTVKAPAKTTPKSASKTTKKVAAPSKTVKKAAPSTKKTAVKTAPAKKAVTAKTTSKATISKTTKTVKKVTSAKTAKATPKASQKSSAKTPTKVTAAKTTKPVAKKAAPVKATKPASKPVAKEQKATKAAPKTTKAKTSPVQNVKTAPAKPVAKIATKAPSSPIVVKMPQNQNAPKVSIVVKPSIAMAPQKTSTSGTPATGMVKPVYRPIQVINKPLAPLQPTRQMAPIEKEAEKIEFKKGDYVCYPAHGVGEIEEVETQTIGGMEIKLYAIAFEKDRMRLKVPVAKAHASGLRRLSSTGRMEDALKTLQGRAHIRRAMWSRRAQEYETKINSGDPVAIAEVLRDLKRSNDESEQSYSERQIYQSALERLAREVAAVEKISEAAAAERLENMIKGRRKKATATDKVDEEEAA